MKIDLLTAIAERVWSKTLGTGMTLEEAANFIRDGHIDKGPIEDAHALEMTLYGHWFELGLPRVVMGHKHAASLMSTTMRAVDVPDLIAPWRVFMLEVPSRMIRDDNGHNVDRMLAVDIEEDGIRSVGGIIIPDNIESAMSGLCKAGSVSELVGENADAAPYKQLLARYLVGAIAEFNTHYPTGEQRAVARKSDPRGKPVTHTFELRREVRVDCRPAVASFLTGERGTAPSVQVLVAGHWKRQPYGIGRAERRWTHVEPYWRGPEDAPIALRPHRLGA